MVSLSLKKLPSSLLVAVEVVVSMLDAMNKARDAIHANCKQDDPQCACVAGCDERIGCACFSTLCLQCHMNWLRGRDPDHLDSDAPCGPIE